MLDDRRPMVVVDLTTGSVTVRLQDVFAQVDATRYADVQAVPFDSGTLLVNRSTGNFNVLGKDNFVLKRSGGGVGLGLLAGALGARGFAAGSSAYIVRYAPQSTVSLVGSDTVQAAVRIVQPGSKRTVTPRGFASLKGAIADRPGGTVVAGQDLWAIVDQGGQDDVVRLHPQASSRFGMDVVDQGEAASGGTPTALEAILAGVAIASPGRVRLYIGGSRSGHRDVTTTATSGATTILPVRGADAAWWFLARDRTGWSVFGVDPTGRVVGPRRLPDVAPAVQLVEPVLSAGRLYTMDRAARSQPALWQIDPHTGVVESIQGEPRYPVANRAERADFSDAEVVASGPRVIFNNPDSLLGVVVFTDGSRAPVVIDKSTAVNVSAIGPSETQGQAPGTAAVAAAGPQPTFPPPIRPAAVPQVSQQVTCANTAQKPRAPQITQAVPSAHSVLVIWSYPLLDNQDCEPDTWAVRVQALNAPQPAQPVQLVSGQLQYQFNGLRPTVNYQVTVTAYIKQQSTPSAPVPFTTPPTGPDAPSAVHTVSDGSGHWIVSWNPCTAANCFVAADTWTVTGASCGGFVGQPPVVQVPGDQTSVSIDASALQLLGASMTFQVQGSSNAGLTGDPTADHTCIQAWRPPDPSRIQMQASAVATGQTVTAKLVVSVNGDPSSAFGSNSAQFTYRVGTAMVGPTTSTSATVPGLTPGPQYQPSVVVNPTGHPQAAVTINGPTISQNLQWPSDLSVAAAASVSSSNPNSGALTASFSNAPTVPLSAAGTITCGSYAQKVGGPLDAARLTVPLNLVQIGGSCGLRVQLSETQTAFYGVASQELSTSFTVPGSQPDQSSFTAAYDNTRFDDPLVVVSGQSGNKGANWSLSIKDPPICTRVVPPISSPSPLAFPQTFHLRGCDLGAPVTLELSWVYLGTQVDFDITPSGSPPPTTTTSTTRISTTTIPSTTSTTAPHPTTTAKPAALASGGQSGPGPPTVLPGPPLPLSATPADRHGGQEFFDLSLAAIAGAIASAAGVRRRRQRRTK